MKIRKYKELILESVRKIYLKIKEDTNNNLAYLIDDGYEVTCKDELRYIIVTVNVKVGRGKPFIGLIWSKIKDDFMTYLEDMNNKYNMEYIELKKAKDLSKNKDYYDDYTDLQPDYYYDRRDKFIKFDELENIKDFDCIFIKVAFNKRWKK